MIKIAPSLLAADFTRLREEIHLIEAAQADLLHLDVMDGHFVPNITFGPPLVSSIRPITRLHLETHLMISEPQKFLEPFARAGSDCIIIHAEAIPDAPLLLQRIRDLGLKAGVSIKPNTPLETILPLFPQVDLILFMTVEPGFGGQAFMPGVMPKIKAAREIVLQNRLDVDLEVDGGINPDTAVQAVAAGANILVAGTAIFGQPDPGKIISKMKALGGN